MTVAMLMLVFLLVPLLVGVGLIVAGMRRRGQGYPSCGRCGYDIRGAERVDDRCPECGTTFTEAGIVPAGRRRGGRALIVSGICVVLVPLTCGAGSVISLVQARSARTRAIQQAITAQQRVNAGTGADADADADAGTGTGTGADADAGTDAGTDGLRPISGGG